MKKRTFYILMIFSMFAWGMSWTNIKILNAYMGTQELIFLRYLVSTISSFFIVIFIKESFKVDKKTMLLVLLAAVVTTIYTILIFIGTDLGTAGLAGAFINTLSPINTFIILAIFFKRKLFRLDFIALFLGFIGTMLILGIWKFDIGTIFAKYNIFFLIAAWLWSIVTIISSFSRKISPVVFSFYIYLFVTIISWFFTDFTYPNDFANVDLKFWINLIFIGVVTTSIATSLFFLGVERLGSAEVSSFMFIVPFSAIGFGAIFLGESIGIITIIGVILCICAIYMLNRIGIFKG